MGPIILLAGTTAAVGLIAPHLESGAGQPGETSDIAVDGTEPGRQTPREAWLTGETVLQREPDGHFYADASVEQRSTHFLIDTGASIVALTGADARAIGLDWDEADLVPIGRGASGEVYGVPVQLKRIELGGIEATDVQAAIIPEGLDVSLLGQSFLSKLRGVRIDGDMMTLGGGS